METILKIKATGDYEFVEVEPDEDGGVGLKTLQDGVGGWIERAPTLNKRLAEIDVFINEEGKLIGLRGNDTVTRLTEIWKAGDYICGDAVLCGHDAEGRSIGLTPAQVKTLREML